MQRFAGCASVACARMHMYARVTCRWLDVVRAWNLDECWGVLSIRVRCLCGLYTDGSNSLLTGATKSKKSGRENDEALNGQYKFSSNQQATSDVCIFLRERKHKLHLSFRYPLFDTGEIIGTKGRRLADKPPLGRGVGAVGVDDWP